MTAVAHETIRPFHVDLPEKALTEMRRRIDATRSLPDHCADPRSLSRVADHGLRAERIPSSSSSTRLPAPEGPGSVSGAPNLPAGFTDTFTSRFIEDNGLRQHAVIGSDGPPLLLVHGRPRAMSAIAVAKRAFGD
jgi:hypothetical protein